MSNTRPVPNDGSDSFIEVSFKEVTAYPARDLPSAQGEKDDEIYDNWKVSETCPHWFYTEYTVE